MSARIETTVMFGCDGVRQVVGAALAALAVGCAARPVPGPQPIPVAKSATEAPSISASGAATNATPSVAETRGPQGPPEKKASEGEVSGGETPSPAPRCPDEMALVVRPQGPYCIDRWEATLVVAEPSGEQPWPGNRYPGSVESKVRAVSEPGRNPQGYISGKQAALACERSGKRLCEIDEWVRACRGPRRTTYPYGNERKKNVCNDRYKIIDHHPVVRLYRQEQGRDADPKGMWDPRWMNDPRLHEYDHTITKTGAKRECTNEYGVYDMVGNLHEWVDDPEGTFFGGFFLDTYQNGEGCEYRTVFHPIGYHDYSTGFRCCRDPDWDRVEAAK